MEEARSLALKAPEDLAAVSNAVPTPAQGLVDILLAGELDTAESVLDRETRGLEFAEIVERILEPAWIDAGDRLFRGLCGLDQERIAGEFLRRKLLGILDTVMRRNSKARGRILLSTLVGDRHEGGLLMLAIHLELAGWRALNLGTEVPINTLLQSIQRFTPVAVGVSFILSRNIRKRFAELTRVKDVPIFVGGRSLLNYQSLARRHGLIPLPGPARNVVDSMIARIESPLGADAVLRRHAERKNSV
jgi:methanogenic corrinoid protein MtbC1